MEQLVKAIEAQMAEFAKNANDQVEKGNKAAGTRARKISLDIEKLLKQFRKESIAATK